MPKYRRLPPISRTPSPPPDVLRQPRLFDGTLLRSVEEDDRDRNDGDDEDGGLAPADTTRPPSPKKRQKPKKRFLSSRKDPTGRSKRRRLRIEEQQRILEDSPDIISEKESDFEGDILETIVVAGGHLMIGTGFARKEEERGDELLAGAQSEKALRNNNQSIITELKRGGDAMGIEKDEADNLQGRETVTTGKRPKPTDSASESEELTVPTQQSGLCAPSATPPSPLGGACAGIARFEQAVVSSSETIKDCNVTGDCPPDLTFVGDAVVLDPKEPDTGGASDGAKSPEPNDLSTNSGSMLDGSSADRKIDPMDEDTLRAVNILFTTANEGYNFLEAPPSLPPVSLPKTIANEQKKSDKIEKGKEPSRLRNHNKALPSTPTENDRSIAFVEKKSLVIKLKVPGPAKLTATTNPGATSQTRVASDQTSVQPTSVLAWPAPPQPAPVAPTLNAKVPSNLRLPAYRRPESTASKSTVNPKATVNGRQQVPGPPRPVFPGVNALLAAREKAEEVRGIKCKATNASTVPVYPAAILPPGYQNNNRAQSPPLQSQPADTTLTRTSPRPLIRTPFAQMAIHKPASYTKPSMSPDTSNSSPMETTKSSANGGNLDQASPAEPTQKPAQPRATSLSPAPLPSPPLAAGSPTPQPRAPPAPTPLVTTPLIPTAPTPLPANGSFSPPKATREINSNPHKYARPFAGVTKEPIRSRPIREASKLLRMGDPVHAKTIEPLVPKSNFLYFEPKAPGSLSDPATTMVSFDSLASKQDGAPRSLHPPPPLRPLSPLPKILAQPENMVFTIARHEDPNGCAKFYGREILRGSDGGDSAKFFSWDKLVEVLQSKLNFVDFKECLVINLHHIVEGEDELNDGLKHGFYSTQNEILVVTLGPLGRLPPALLPKMKAARKALREASVE